MNHEPYRQTLDELFKYNGLEGVLGYFVNHEKLSREDAESKCAAWGYNPVAPEQVTPVSNDVEPVILAEEATGPMDVEHIVSEEDVELNPGEDLTVGETILLPVYNTTDEGTPENLQDKKLSLLNKLFGI